MQPLVPADLIGTRIADIVVSVPDRPVTMSDQSFSAGYLQLDNGVVIDLSRSAPLYPHEGDLNSIKRDQKYEKQFQPAIGNKIADVLQISDLARICIVTEGGWVITNVPALFWERPCIARVSEFTEKMEPWGTT